MSLVEDDGITGNPMSFRLFALPDLHLAGPSFTTVSLAFSTDVGT